MTPLKPLENLRVRGAEHGPSSYQLNEVCAHPECTEPVGGKHHCFPKSQLNGDYWYAIVTDPDDVIPGHPGSIEVIVPVVIGLCGSGTTGHHGDVESHAAWIKLEDGEFVWYDRREAGGSAEWERLGPLNPQPGSREGKPKRKKFQGEARRSKSTVSIKVPQDSREDGAGVLLDLLEQAGEVIVKVGLYKDPPPAYYVYVAALTFFVTHALEVEG